MTPALRGVLETSLYVSDLERSREFYGARRRRSRVGSVGTGVARASISATPTVTFWN